MCVPSDAYEIFGVVDDALMKFSVHVKRTVSCQLVTTYHHTGMDMASDKLKASSRNSYFYLKSRTSSDYIGLDCLQCTRPIPIFKATIFSADNSCFVASYHRC
ncbi:hypothetical protein RF11_08230 [Thelohanellus kitauei]|uniref:Uncharacterized protein n=1 Tax=Thelohanellus kitauei TaxID=669202 RepID=A0A0C2JWL7_THEKT|nr:hypothetical protein RF11_08230 [Thelohanellus kitauei]